MCPRKARRNRKCLTGNFRYDVKLRALDDLAQFSRPNTPDPLRKTRIYKCRLCGGWHLTSRKLLRPRD
jgi:hypothetical protein